jgi:hypothetical protein
MAVREQDLPEKYQVSSIWYTRCPSSSRFVD